MNVHTLGNHGLVTDQSFILDLLCVPSCKSLLLTLIMHLQSCIVLDIEGTTSPISFVMEVLFPYARDNVQKHLTATYDSKETQVDIKLLRAQVSYHLIRVCSMVICMTWILLLGSHAIMVLATSNSDMYNA